MLQPLSIEEILEAAGVTPECKKQKVEAQRQRDNFKKRWSNMMARCYDDSHPNYKWWGGRGIQVCLRWHSYDNFYADMWPVPFEGAQIDRIDNNGDYSPENTRWATQQENLKNRPSKRFFLPKPKK